MINVYQRRDLKREFRGYHTLVISKKNDWYKAFLSVKKDTNEPDAKRAYSGIDSGFAKDVIIDVYLLSK